MGSLGFFKSTSCRAPVGQALAARRCQSLGDAVIAERAFVRDLLLRMDVAASIRTGLHAVGATEAILLIHQHHAVGSSRTSHPPGTPACTANPRSGCTSWEQRNTCPHLLSLRGKSFLAAIGRNDLRDWSCFRRRRGSAPPRCGSSHRAHRSRPRRRARSCRSRCTWARRSTCPTSDRSSCSSELASGVPASTDFHATAAAGSRTRK